jgi:hypothetical protein
MAIDLTGGLPLGRDDVFEAAPDDPEMREGINIWLHDDQGRFSLPRIGIEAVSAGWDRPAVLANLGFPDGRVLVGSCVGEARSPYDENGRPRVRAAGPIEFRCLEPFRRWRMTYRGDALDTTIVDQLAGHVPDGPRVEVGIDVEMTMAVPPWIQGAMGEDAARRLAGGTEALFMGGDRYEQLFRASGTLRVGTETTEFTATGVRIHRQGVRDTAEFRGHCWQSAVFPSGRAFGYIAFPDHEDGRRAYREGFVFDGEKMLPAVVADAPWLTSFQAEGGQVPLVLETANGTHRIDGVSTTSTVMAGNASLRKVAAMKSRERVHSMFFHQGGAHYTWDGEQAYGILERSLPEERVAR